jgi:threonylcarbamoyladenosine tRNA methylthiotransferase MtaB
MATFFIQNFGCRATQADASAIRHSLISRGYSAANSERAADIIVLNTCTVTAAADAEARETARRLHRANPRARIVMTGCYAQRAPEELAAVEGVSLVVGNSHQSEIASLLGTSRSYIPLAQLEHSSAVRAPVFRTEIGAQSNINVSAPGESVGERTRPILKIQDGCNHRCSYCVIPFVRGNSRSLPPDRVIHEIHRLVAAGAREIVLSGIDLGSYGRTLSPKANLQSLIRRILDETSLNQLRISSIEPMDVTSDLIELVASTGRLAPHFHMPLQSGSDRILRAMHRWYRAAHYARRVELIRERLPHAAIGADVIAGFPGETEVDHQLTTHFLENLSLAYLHVFSFSPRPGTEAASLPAATAVPPEIIQRRARELRALAAEKLKAFRASQKGSRLRVLTLVRATENWTEAISGNYLKVRLAGRWPRNHWFDVTFDDSAAPLAAKPAEIQLSKITSAKAIFPLCVIESENLVAPNRAACSPAAPANEIVGFPPA